jgi:hypothetical protein
MQTTSQATIQLTNQPTNHLTQYHSNSLSQQLLNQSRYSPHFSVSRRFITVFTQAFQQSLWIRKAQSTPSHPISLEYLVVLSYQLVSCLYQLLLSFSKTKSRHRRATEGAVFRSVPSQRLTHF